jgi:hypothetical protein
MDTTEGNRLINKFMVYRRSYNPKYLKYHQSWNWLMPVVDKLNEYTYETIIGESYKNYIKDGLIKANKKQVWLGCIRTIKWINKHDK